MKRRSRIAQVAVTAGVLGGLAAVCVTNRRELGATLAHLSPVVFAAAVMLQLLTLVARAESWGRTLAAIERRPLSRRSVHGASAVGFGAAAVETHLALPARLATLKRLAPDDAPRVTQMLLSDLPLMALEGFCAAVLLVVAAAALPSLEWWWVPGVMTVAATGVVALRLARGRLGAHALSGGLAILEARDLRGRLAGLAVTIVGISLTRISILLAACGLAADPAHVALTYIAVSVLGLLPIGAASNPAATIATAGAASVGAATAAGLALAASSTAAVVLYGGGVAALGWLGTPGYSRPRRPPRLRPRPRRRGNSAAATRTSRRAARSGPT